ncbi:MAG TPA: hypothetical protein PK239_02705 [Chitinophagales bacterium]|nr:hypothetical protein [Chitinophagales bacterium]
MPVLDNEKENFTAPCFAPLWVSCVTEKQRYAKTVHLPTGIYLGGKTLPQKAKTMTTAGNNRQIMYVKR